MRTAAKLCLSFCIGVFLATICGVSLPFLAAAALGVAALVTYLLRSLLSSKRIWAFVLIAAIGATYFSCYISMTVLRGQPFGGETVVVSGNISEISERENGYTYTIKADTIENTRFVVPLSLNLYTDEDINVDYGDLLTVTADFYPVDYTKPTALWENLAADGIYLTGSMVSLLSVTPQRATLSSVCLSIRDALEESIDLYVTSPENALMNGILFGDTDNISYSTIRDFNLSGISHILSVSGVHIAIITALALGIFELLRVPAKLSRISVLFFLLAFCAIVGFTPPVVRSALMASMLAVSKVGYRYIDGVDSLAIAAVIILIFSPYCVVDMSFLLSFFSTLGILLFSQPISKRLNRGRISPISKIASESIGISISALVFTTPLLAIAFGVIVVVSPIVNLCILPLMTPIMLFGLLTAVAGLFCQPLGQFFGFVSGRLSSLLSAIASFFSELPFAILPAGYNYVPLLVLCCISLFGIAFALKRNKYVFKVVSLLSLNLILLSAFSYQIFSANNMEITVLSSYYQNSIIINCCDKTVVLNCSDEYSARAVCNYTDSHGIEDIDLMTFAGIENPSIDGAEILLKEIPISVIAVPYQNSFEDFSYIAQDSSTKIAVSDIMEAQMSLVTVTEKEIGGSDLFTLSCGGFTLGYSKNSSTLAAASKETPFDVVIIDSEKAPSVSQINSSAVVWLKDVDFVEQHDGYTIIPKELTTQIITDGNYLSIR